MKILTLSQREYPENTKSAVELPFREGPASALAAVLSFAAVFVAIGPTIGPAASFSFAVVFSPILAPALALAVVLAFTRMLWKGLFFRVCHGLKRDPGTVRRARGIGSRSDGSA
jgi:hypothetical protein